MMSETLGKRFPLFLIGSVLLVPGLLFAAGVFTPLYFLAAFLAALFLAVFIVNFEAGFLALIFVRSSLDLFKQLVPAGGPNVAAAAGVLLIVLGIFYILYRRIDVLQYEETRPFLLFLAVCGASVAFSPDKFASVADWLRLVSVFFIYVFARHITRTKRQMKLVLCLVLLSAFLPVLVAFAQLAAGTGLKGGRLTGTFYHPNAFASYLLVLLIIAGGQVLEKKSLLPKALLVPFVGLSLVAFVLTLSRGAWIVSIVAALVIGALRHRKLLVLVPLLLVGSVAFIPSVQDRIKDVTDPSFNRSRSAWQWRLDAWNEIMPLVKAKPIFGNGISMVNTQMGYMAHNDYLRLLAEVGIVGLLAYLFMMTSLLKRVWEDFWRARSDVGRSFQLGLLAMITAFLVREVADNTLRNTVVLLYFWIFVAIVRNMAVLERSGELRDA